MRFVPIALLLSGCASIHRQQAVGTTAIASRLHDKDGGPGIAPRRADSLIRYRYGVPSLCTNFHFPSTICAFMSSSG